MIALFLALSLAGPPLSLEGSPEPPAPLAEDDFEAQAAQKRREALAGIHGPLPPGDLGAEMMLRVAELYTEEGRYLYRMERRRFQESYDQCLKTPGCDPQGLAADHAESRKFMESAIALYRRVLEEHPRYERTDEALFHLASALRETGQPEEALAHLTHLARTYPESRYIPDAYLQIGEHYFDQGEPMKALLAYDRASRFEGFDKYAYALYKLAWCYYSVGEHRKAIDTLKALVASQDGSSRLREEALKDLPRFYADAGQVDEAEAYFAGLGERDLFLSMLARLAAIYGEQGKHEQSVQVYRRLLAEAPLAPEAPGYQYAIIEAYRAMGRAPEAQAEAERLRALYGAGSAWVRANLDNQAALQEAAEHLRRAAQ